MCKNSMLLDIMLHVMIFNKCSPAILELISVNLIKETKEEIKDLVVIKDKEVSEEECNNHKYNLNSNNLLNNYQCKMLNLSQYNNLNSQFNNHSSHNKTNKYHNFHSQINSNNNHSNHKTSLNNQLLFNQFNNNQKLYL